MQPVNIVLLLSILVLSNCAKPEPVRLGFIAGLSGAVSDVGLASRNGTMLAIEEQNARGGLFGQPVELITVNNHLSLERLREGTQSLIDEQVDIIIGPSISSMAVGMVEMINVAQIPTIGTTIATTELSNKDDYFFRTASDTSFSTDHFAEAIYGLGVRSYTIVLDTSNSSYTEGWRNEFLQDAIPLGLAEQEVLRFESKEDKTGLLSIVSEIKNIDTEMYLFVTNSVDTALLIQQLKNMGFGGAIGASEWAGTDQLIQLLGTDAEGVYVNRYLDINSVEPRFIALKQTYKARFQSELEFPALMAYNATNIAMEVLQHSRDGAEIKAELIKRGTFSTVFADVEFNQYGDEVGAGFLTLTQIKNKQFITIDSSK